MSWQTDKSDLRIKLYRKAKKEPDSVFISSTTRYTRRHSDPRVHAAKSNRAPDGWEASSIESRVQGRWNVERTREELHDKTYQPQPCGGDDPEAGRDGARNPTIRTVAQTAAKLIWNDLRGGLEPNAYGYRPKRSAQDAIGRWMNCCIRLRRRRRRSVEILDTIPHSELMRACSRIVDKHMLH